MPQPEDTKILKYPPLRWMSVSGGGRPNEREAGGDMIYFFYCMMLLSSPNAKPIIPYYIPVVPPRGLDSVYTLPHDTVVNCRNEPGPCPGYPGAKSDSTLVGNGLPYYGLTVSCAVLHLREVCDTIKIPGAWWYFNWSNGKRVNMRLSK